MQSKISFILGIGIGISSMVAYGLLTNTSSNDNSSLSSGTKRAAGSSINASHIFKGENLEFQSAYDQHISKSQLDSTFTFLCQQGEQGNINFSKVIDFFLSMSEEEQIVNFDRMMDSWAKIDPIAALDSLNGQMREFVGNEFEYFHDKVLASIAEHHPQVGLKVFDQVPPGYGREKFAIRLADGLAKLDFQQAFEFLEQLPSKDVSTWGIDQSYVVIMEQFVEKDLWAAAEAVSLLKSDSVQSRLVGLIAEKIAVDDYSRGISWVTNLENDKARSDGIKALAEAPNQDSALLMTTVLENHDQISRSALTYSLLTLADEAPQLVADQFDRLPDDVKVTAGSKLVSEWVLDDEGSALAWLSNVDDPALFDLGAQEAVKHFTYRDPLQAVDWAAKIQNPEKKGSTLDHVINSIPAIELNSLLERIPTLEMSEQDKRTITSSVADRVNNIGAPLVIPEL